MNSATDNPLISVEEGVVLEGGNFYGQHIANVSDALSNAIIQCAIHAERIVSRLVEPTRNRGKQTVLMLKTTTLVIHFSNPLQGFPLIFKAL